MTTATDIGLRPADAKDRELLRELYRSTRAHELALMPWDNAAERAFVEQQFSAQDAHYRRHYPGATFDVVEVAGEPVGRLYLHRGQAEIRVMDIALLPAFRGQGIGTRLLRGVLGEARASGRTVSVHVELANPARALYERLGFEPVEPHGTHLLMTATPTEA
jgi:GNAT superfamily N-acetyltransferase